jgi:hypothetical protein
MQHGLGTKAIWWSKRSIPQRKVLEGSLKTYGDYARIQHGMKHPKQRNVKKRIKQDCRGAPDVAPHKCSPCTKEWNEHWVHRTCTCALDMCTWYHTGQRRMVRAITCTRELTTHWICQVAHGIPHWIRYLEELQMNQVVFTYSSIYINLLVVQYLCKENGPRAIWLIEFWCLMNNTIRELISFLVFVFVVHRMRRELDQGNEDATPQMKT